MAIWNRNIIVSIIAIGVWAGALALHLRSTWGIRSCLQHHLMPPVCATKAWR